MATQSSGLVDGSGSIRDNLFGRRRNFCDHHGACQGRADARLQKLFPALLGPLGTVFGLLVVFSVVQVWSDMDRANVAVNREASAIRMVALLAPSFPGEPETQILDLLRHHIDEAVFAEWRTMAKQSASLRVAPPALAEALRLAVSLAPNGERQIAAQREIVTELENAMDARRSALSSAGRA